MNRSQINTIVVQYWQSIIARYREIVRGYLPEILVLLLTIACSSLFLLTEAAISARLCSWICAVCGIYAFLRQKSFLIVVCVVIGLLAQSQQDRLAENFSAAEEWFEEHGEIVGRGAYFRIETTGVVEQTLDASEVHARRVIFVLRPEGCFVNAQTPCVFRVLLSVADLPWSDAAAFDANALITIRAKIRLLAQSEDRSGYENYLYRRNIIGQGYLESEATILSPGVMNHQDALVVFLIKRFVRDEGMAVLIAAVLGEHSLLGIELKDIFKNLGIMHLLVVSGFHIALIYLIFRVTFRALISLSLVVTSYFNANVIASIVALFFCYIYVVATDAGLSSERSLVMLATYCFAGLIYRKASRVNVLLISFIVMNLLWPAAILDIGCQLTYAALLGLFLADIFIKYALSEEIPKLWQKIFAAYFFSYFAWLFTAPILFYWFEAVPLVGPVINLLVVAYFSFAIIGLGLVGILLSLFEVNWLDTAWYCAQVAAMFLFQQMRAIDSFLLDKPWAILTKESRGLATWSTIVLLTMPLIGVVCWSRLKLWLQARRHFAILREAQNPLTWSREASKEANDFKNLFHRSR